MTESVDPPINTLNTPFWEAARGGTLLLPHCAKSGRAFWPPSPVSPYVTGGEVAWQAVSPTGILRASVVYERVFQMAFKPLAPYRVGLVELDCGVRLQAYHAGPSGAPAIGDRVTIGFRHLAGGNYPVPVIIEPQD
jgi:uncharacterized OB-fold protein